MTRIIAAQRHAFTLIELLVVITIISLLISILLPSLRGAREMAIQLQCMNNLRSVNMVGIQYAFENHGYPAPHPFSVTPGLTNDQVPRWWRANEASAIYPAMQGIGYLFGYTTDTPDDEMVWYRTNGCPSYHRGVQSHDQAFTESCYLAGLEGANSRDGWYRIGDPKIEPANTLLFTEHNRNEINGSSTAPAFHITLFDQPRSTGGYNHYGRHDARGLNLACIDGHVVFSQNLSGDSSIAQMDPLPILKP